MTTCGNNCANCTDDKKMAELISYIDDIKEHNKRDSHLIGILHKAQDLFGYLSKNVMNEVAYRMNIPTAHIWGVATFYHYFKLKPQGKHTISVCLGTACYVKGAREILNAIQSELNINFGETTQDKIFTLSEARCLGACGLAPVIMIDDKIYGELTPKKVIDIIRDYAAKVLDASR
jgi:NADH-quinone oxidoreductase subunit E/NADP-reducing hydrogenase subunit HndA